ncbi:MAG: hypothetical protein IRY96_01205 [Burkholderiales bacterium]|nr:hypothetical protein [Burkholderiales bacterium]
MTRRSRGPVAAAALVAALAGCMHYDRHHDERHGPPSHARGADAGARVNVPPGHMPPPGQCRIWYPDRPPGQQPPSGDCRELGRRVPEDAVLIRGR